MVDISFGAFVCLVNNIKFENIILWICLINSYLIEGVCF